MWWQEFLRQTPALATLGAAYLVYQSGNRSSDRESKDRQDERDAAAAQRDHDYKMKQLESEGHRKAEEEQRQLERVERERERYLRFLRAAQSAWMYLVANNAQFPSTMQDELAASYEDAMLGSPHWLRDNMVLVKGDLQTMVIEGNDLSARLETNMNTLRGDISSLLGGDY